MTVIPGTRLGPYEIGPQIGAGGMGEVFRARDTRLDRSVAIKILPAAFAANAQLRARFEREAKTISQLNHPNICTLYDVGENYLVMELVDGESLADRLSRGPLPMPEVLRYGAQVGEALDRAHRAGVVHRDLKPANVMITKDGAKLLDFGLAKSGITIEMSVQDATQHKPLTEEGTILGTFQYMAPEQLEGAEADARTDIFALGGLLYEMATGQRAFDGKTKTSLIAQIVAASPRPLRELQPLTPPAFEHAVEKCLAKDPDERWQSARDVAGELRWVSTLTSSQPGATSDAASARHSRRTAQRVLTVAALIAIAALTAALVYQGRRLGEASRVMRFEVVPAENLASVVHGPAAISPDGNTLALLVDHGEGTDRLLATRDVSSGETRLISGTGGAMFPFWSPDSSTIGFFGNGKLCTVPRSGGAVQVLCDAPEGRGGSWGTADEIVFTPNIQEAIYKVPAGGGTPVRVTDNKSAATHRNPSFLPDGKTFLYVVRDDGSGKEPAVAVGSTSGNLQRQIIVGGSNMQYFDGRLLYMRSGNLVAQKFDPRAIELSGPPVPVAARVEYFEPRDVGNFSLSQNGILVYRTAVLPSTQFVWFSRGGQALGPASPAGAYTGAVISPDGRKVLTLVGDRNGADLWLLHLDRQGGTRLTFDSSSLVNGAISPDGTRVAISSGGTLGRAHRVWIQNLNGQGAKTNISCPSATCLVNGWSPDGRFVVVTAQQSATRFDITILPAAGGAAIVLVNSPANERNGAISPDGTSLAYQSDESGRVEVYVTTFPDARGKVQVSFDGGASPQWGADSKTLHFHNGGNLYSSRRAPSGEFDAPVVLPIPVTPSTPSVGAGNTYGVAPDGRILVLTNLARDVNPLRVVLNWREALPK